VAVILMVFGVILSLILLGLYYRYLLFICDFLAPEEKEVVKIMNEAIAVKFGIVHSMN
jgi:hypothetical protein